MPLMSPKRPQIHLLFEELVPWRVLAAVGHLITRSTRAPNNWLHEGHLRLLSLPDSLDHPVLLAERAAIVLFHPQGHAAVVEGMIAFSPDHNTILLFVFSLTSKTGIHHLDPADGARIALHVPAPHGHRVPLLEREHFVTARLGSCAPRVRGQGTGFLTVFHVGHSGGAEPATETLGRGDRKSVV